MQYSPGKLAIFIVLMFAFSIAAKADIAVVVNANNNLQSLDRRQVTDLFLGRYVAFPNGSAALPLDQPINSKEREQFYKHLTGRTVPQINAYWAKLIFSGRATPPRVAQKASDILTMIKNNKNAIAYIKRDMVDDSVKIVLIIPASQHPSIPASQHPSIPASQHPSIPASQHPSIPASQHPSN